MLRNRNLAVLSAGLLAGALQLAAADGSSAGDTRVAEAAMQGNRDLVRDLIKRKASVDAAQGDGMTALHWAAFHDDLELARLLLRSGAGVKAVTRLEGATPLMLAAPSGDAALIADLLKAGADANAANLLGTTPLMAAATSGSVEAVKALLDHGADINAKENAHGQTALMFAADDNRGDVIRLLAARGADLTAVTRVETLERPTVDEDGNPLPTRAPRAAPTNPAAIAAAARRANAAKIGGMTALLFAARDNKFDAARALVESGAKVNQPGEADQTPPMIMAIINGHYDLAQYFLDHGADPNQPTADGLAPLYATIDAQWPPIGWSPNPITIQEKVTYLDLMKALLDRGADPNARLTHKLWFRPTSHDMMWVGSAGSTAFWRAAQSTDLKAMHLLIDHGADPKIASLDGTTALGIAAGLGWAGNFSTNAPDSAFDAAKYCIDLGIDVNVQDVQGYTAVMGAAYRGENDLVKLLAAKGAKLDARTGRGWSVTDMANGPSLRSSVPMAHTDTVALLRSLGAPELTAVEGEEILGIIRRRPAKVGKPEEDKPAPAADPAVKSEPAAAPAATPETPASTAPPAKSETPAAPVQPAAKP